MKRQGARGTAQTAIAARSGRCGWTHVGRIEMTAAITTSLNPLATYSAPGYQGPDQKPS
jgi:hypothetical protein